MISNAIFLNDFLPTSGFGTVHCTCSLVRNDAFIERPRHCFIRTIVSSALPYLLILYNYIPLFALFCVCDSCFVGRHVPSIFEEQYIFKSLVAALIKKRNISTLMILRCSVVCMFFPPPWSLTVTIHRVLDDVAATHTTSTCVYVATRGRKQVS